MDKTTLDSLLKKHKAQPVGHGYIDIIVTRSNYKHFISDLVNYGYIISSISWWEWCPNESENEYGLGGPKSIFYDGWFSELPIDIDDFKLDTEVKSEEIIREIIDTIETKQITFTDKTASFKESNWLTPAIWLDVPDDWRNNLPERV